MARHPFRPELSAECRNSAGLPADYLTELSYETIDNLIWFVMDKGTTHLEHAEPPILETLVAQVAGVLRRGKQLIDRNKGLGDYVDVNIALPYKPPPTQPLDNRTPTRPGQV